VRLFRELRTQWQVGGLGVPVGLRYEVLPFLLRLQGVPRADWPVLLDHLRVMEGAALGYWARQAAARRALAARGRLH
jgi:hypothetical protein